MSSPRSKKAQHAATPRNTQARATSVADAYRTLLAPHLGPGFRFEEICHRATPRKALPPAGLRANIVPTLALANALRDAIMQRGAHGLLVHAAYRPDGGAANSQHKHNRALDLDLIPQDYDLADEFYEEATKLWCALGRERKIGLGLYCERGRAGGIRVHFDVGYQCRTWQHRGAATSVKPPVAHAIAKRLGLTVP